MCFQEELELLFLHLQLLDFLLQTLLLLFQTLSLLQQYIAPQYSPKCKCKYWA
jgi:hypothetical protein